MDADRPVLESQSEEPEHGAISQSVSSSATSATPARSPLARRLFLLLAAVAVLYGFVSGLRTISDPDLFWQLATGRWVAQHHQIFSTDVFSYTAAGQPWTYPVGGSLLFYAAYLVGGYGLLSWIGAIVCVGTIALLLRRGTPITAALTIIAVPLIAKRSSPRAEIFTIILFAAFLSILWENYQTSRARLWLLLPLMLVWVNCHLGFVSGLALMVAFAGMDVLEMLYSGERRHDATQRLRRALPWFGAVALCTLANPWGWKIYEAVLRQNRAMAEHSMWIAEWGKVPLSRTALSQAFSLTNGDPFYLLLVVVVIATVLALLRRQLGAAILMVGATYPGVQHVRMDSLSGSVIVVVAGSILYTTVLELDARIPNARARLVLATTAAAMFVILGVVRSADAMKIREMALSTYGAGPSWWFPKRAIEFIQRENVPGEIFNTYIQGGYLTWTLGPGRRDYIDGRAIPFGSQAFMHQAELMQSSPDSSLWRTEADRYNINAVILPLNRFESALGDLKNFCNSAQWRPVYLDETAGVFVRRKPETEDLIRRANVDCATTPLPGTNIDGPEAIRFNRWADTASVLAALGRNTEALSAAEQAEQALPNTYFVPWIRGNIYYMMGLRADAEREYLKSIAIEPNVPLVWFSLAAVYKHEGRIPDTIEAQRKAIQLSTMPQPAELVKLARLYLDSQQPRAALDTFDEAARVASPDLLAPTGAYSLSFEVDQGRAAAWKALGDPKQAAAFDQKAAQDLVPRN
jgi:tetratricopeptide (TPR) repeat protein